VRVGARCAGAHSLTTFVQLLSRLERAKAQAGRISEQDDMNEAAKSRAIEKLYRRATHEKRKKTVLGRGGTKSGRARDRQGRPWHATQERRSAHEEYAILRARASGLCECRSCCVSRAVVR
jgi:hypothetical protein